MRKVLDLNTKIILLGKWRSEGIRCLFGQQRACNVPQWSYTIFGTASVSNGSRRGLKEVLTNSLLSNLFQAVFGKEFCKRAPMLRRRTTFSFHCYKPFSFTFWILSKIESANFGFWVVFLWSSLWTWNHNGFKFPTFLELNNSSGGSYLHVTLTVTFARHAHGHARTLFTFFPSDFRGKKRLLKVKN